MALDRKAGALLRIAERLENTRLGRDDMTPEDAFRDAMSAVAEAIRAEVAFAQKSSSEG